MLRVAHVIESADARSGGTTTAFLSILDAIDARADRLRATAYTVRPPPDDPLWQRINAEPERFKLADSRGRLRRPAHLGRLLADDIAASNYDVLHIHGMWSPDLVHAAAAAKAAGIPVLWQSHGMMLRWAMNYKRLKKRVFMAMGLRRALRDASGFICMTRDEIVQSVFPDTCLPERKFLVPLPVTMPPRTPDRASLRAAGRERWGLPGDAAVFAFLGRLHPVKRVDMTIDAFAAAISGPLDAHARLLILGKGDDEYERMLRDLCHRLGVADRVVFAGWVGADLKPLALAAAEALVVNSSIESFGYVLFEAIAVGTPVIITGNISLATEFQQAGAAIRADNTTTALAAAMRDMARRSPDARRDMADRGFAWARQAFSLDTVGRLLEETYHAVIRR
ncbi:MAG: glycosyltransferase [Phycisphaerales bacterium]